MEHYSYQERLSSHSSSPAVRRSSTDKKTNTVIPTIMIHYVYHYELYFMKYFPSMMGHHHFHNFYSILTFLIFSFKNSFEEFESSFVLLVLFLLCARPNTVF